MKQSIRELVVALLLSAFAFASDELTLYELLQCRKFRQFLPGRTQAPIGEEY
jgi:hypothetical protein